MKVEYLLDDLKLWWHNDIPTKDRHEKIVDLVNRIKLDQQYIDKDNLDHLKLYIKRGYMADADGNIQPAGSYPRIGINAVKSAIDTIAARITQQDPRPKFDTDGGRWEQRRKAKKLEKFVAGVFHEEDYYHKLRRAFKDAAIFGTGFMKWYFEKGKVRWERVWPGEVVVDEGAAMNCDPRSIFQVKLVPLEALIAKFPKYQADILSSKVTYRTRVDGHSTTLIKVIEAWHLKDRNGDDGRHTLCCDGVTLHDEEWDYDCLPFIVFRWNELPVGFYGNGAAEDLHGLQEEIDYMMLRIQKSMHINANAWLLKHESDKTPNQHFTNQIGNIIEWSGQYPPELKVMPALHQQCFDHVKWLNELIYNETGVSQFSATSQKPKGVEAAAALQTLLDVESNRFTLLQKAYERAVVQSAEATVECARRNYKGSSKSEYKVKFDNGRYIETINWSEVSLPSDEYILKVWPVNMLPSTPAGKMDTVDRMMQAGLVDAQTAMMLLDFPDIEAHQSLALSSTKQALWIVDQILYEDKEIFPKEWYDLGKCVRFMQMGMANAEMEGAPEEVLDRGLEFVALCQEMLTPPEPPPGPEEQALMQDPQGAMEMAMGQMAPPSMGMDPMADPAMMGPMPPQGAM